MKFMVCPHDTASNPDKWFHLAQHLSKNSNAGVKFDKSLDFGEYHQQLTTGGLIYANPQDSLRLISEHGYTPVARSTNLFDEIVFIAKSSLTEPKIDDLRGKVVTSVNTMMVTRVGVKFLFDNNIIPAKIQSQPTWMAVVKGVFREEQDYGLVYKDFYDGLNSLTKSGFTTLGNTEDGTIYHSVLIAPEFAALADDVQHCLVGMAEHGDRGREILRELGIDRFTPVGPADILQFQTLSTLGQELMNDGS